MGVIKSDGGRQLRGKQLAEAKGAARARSASEAFLYRRFETLREFSGKFRLNSLLPIQFDAQGNMEVDFFVPS